MNAASTPASRAKDNADELALLVPMAIEPEEVSWREDNSDGSNRKLTAVLLFSPANAEKVVESALKHGSVQESTIEVPRWFPAELVSQSELSEGGVVNVEIYPAADFLQAPFTQGRLSRVKGTDHFVLELSAR